MFQNPSKHTQSALKLSITNNFAKISTYRTIFGQLHYTGCILSSTTLQNVQNPAQKYTGCSKKFEVNITS